MSPRELFARCTAVPNDENAWREFLQRYRPVIFSAIYRIIGYPPSGRYHYLFQDILQRVHLRLLENNRRALHSFRGESEEIAQAYLRRIAISIALKMLPHRGRFRLPLEKIMNETPGFNSHVLDEHAGISEDYVALRQDIDIGLSKILRGRKKYRNMLIFKLSLFSGLTAPEIAGVTGLKINSVHALEQLIYRTRDKLAQYLRKAGAN